MAHSGRTVLVTGGAGGLGRAIAENFLEAGANVVICDVSPKLLAEYNEKVIASNPDRTLAIECDITSEQALDDLFAQAEKKFGPLDYVINNAGIMDSFHPAGSLEKSEWDRVIAVNLTAPTFVTKRAVNSFLKADKRGSIVNIASIASFRGWASGSAYTASKAGLVGLTKSTAAFYRTKGIRCNAIQCGAMQTNIGQHFAAGFSQEGMDLSSKNYGSWEGSFSDIQKVAKLAAFLCSDEGDAITGAAVTADRGYTAA